MPDNDMIDIDIEEDDASNNNDEPQVTLDTKSLNGSRDSDHDVNVWEDHSSYKMDGMDAESRALIEQMLLEEQFYYGKDSMSQLASKSTNKKRKAQAKEGNLNGKKRKSEKRASTPTGDKTEVASRSSASLPSHKARWTPEEDELLRAAIETHGYGNWKAVSKHVSTRNALQCKNRARHWVLSDKLDKNTLVRKNDESRNKAEPSVDEPKKHVSSEEDNDDISVDDNEPEYQHAIVDIKNEPSETSPDQDTMSDVQPENQDSETSEQAAGSQLIQQEINDRVSQGNEENDIHAQIINEMDDTKTASQTMASDMEEDSHETTQKPDPSDMESNSQSDDKLFDRFSVSDQEKRDNAEWFSNKVSKTPERYLKIRNHILDCWKACRPRYLTKTSARKGLRDCGDVNAIGRVHTYLESVGAINVNCVNNAPRPPKRQAREVYEDDDVDMFAAADLVIDYEGPRKRKVRNEHGEWVDPRDLEGRVIEHSKPSDQPSRPKRIPKRPQHYSSSDEFGRGYDPFRLVPLEHYNDRDPAPFTLQITSDSLLVMDFHAHLAHTEIIGLLGGTFEVKDGSKILTVESVFPCRSTSTGIQCEMDPESEMKARDVFAEKNLVVVGWYHSHPTFEPHPSIRDIENQTSYQTLFRHENTGDEPFIGVIVSPYDPETVGETSQIQYLHISNRWNETKLFRIPYACRRMIKQCDKVSPEIFSQFKALVEEFKDYEHKMDMEEPFGNSTRLEKLLDSLRSNVFLPPQEEAEFVDTVRDLMQVYLVKKKVPEAQDPSNDTTSLDSGPQPQKKEESPPELTSEHPSSLAS